MAIPEIEEFAKALIQYVRDEAIAGCDMSRNPRCKSLEARRWRHKMASEQFDDVLAEVIPDCVDKTLFYLLHAIDNGLLPLSFKTSSGQTIDLVQQGLSELAGWYAGGAPDGWRFQFSNERCHDDFSNLE